MSLLTAKDQGEGQHQWLMGVGCENAAPVDVVFVVDSSGSISRDDFERVVELVGAVVQSLTIRSDLTPNGFQVALVSFADDVDVRFNLSTYTDKELMLAAVTARYTHGRTNVTQALRYSSFNSSFFTANDVEAYTSCQFTLRLRALCRIYRRWDIIRPI